MERKILTFLKRWFINQGDCCPKEKLDSFLINDFNESERGDAIGFINKLMDRKWIQHTTKNGNEYIAVTAYGAEMLNRNQLPYCEEEHEN